jgi:hypothetical protein
MNKRLENPTDASFTQVMTLRDYFAGQALAGFAADGEAPFEGIIDMSWKLADAMLKARGDQS